MQGLSMRGCMVSILGSLSFAALALPAMAQNYCYVPSPPYCADMYGRFNDQYEFDVCRQEVESYRSKVRLYVLCLSEERDVAISKVKKVVDAFNQKASPHG